MAKKKIKMFIVEGCHSCPNIMNKPTDGAGYAIDYFCKKTGTKVAGYVEWERDKRNDGDFPEDCPL